jgi:hypothetical protein
VLFFRIYNVKLSSFIKRMGITQSKSQQVPAILPSGLPRTPTFTAPNNIVDKIKGLGDVIKHFNENDTTSIEGFIDNFNKQVSDKEKIDLGPEVKSLMLSFHNQVLEVIDSQLGANSTPEEKQAVLKAKLKDNKQLNEMLKMYYDKKLMDFETKVFSDETVRDNPEVMSTVSNIMNNVKSLKVKYKFFEYKYIQMNVFLIVFIQYVYNSMSKFIVDVIAYNQTRDAIRQEMTKKIFEATQKILGASDLQMKPEDADSINRLIFNLQQKVQKDQTEIQELSGKLKNNSLSDLLNFVLTSDETLASHIMEGVEKYKQTSKPTNAQQTSKPTNAQQTSKPTNAQGNKGQQQYQQKAQYIQGQYQGVKPTPQPQTNYPKQIVEQNIPKTNSSENTSQQGGFVRGSSMFPQAFFELTK